MSPHPWAKRALDLTSGQALGLGIAIRSDFRVDSADMGAQTRHFEGSLALARLLAVLVTTRPNLVSHKLIEKEQLYAYPEGHPRPVYLVCLLLLPICSGARWICTEENIDHDLKDSRR